MLLAKETWICEDCGKIYDTEEEADDCDCDEDECPICGGNQKDCGCDE